MCACVTQAAPVLAHFLTVNGRATDDVGAAQQCFNAAFALQTVLRAFPRPLVTVGGEVLEIDEHSDVATVFAPLFRATTAKKTKKMKTKKTTKENGEVVGGKETDEDKTSSTSSRSKSKKRKN